MKNDIKRLPYQENNKIPKKNLFIIIFSVCLSLVIILSLAFYFLIYKSDANLLKRYLLGEGYNCNNITCNKKEKGYTYSFNYKKNTLTASNKNYTIEISNNHPYLEVRDINLVCEYEKDDYNGNDKIDDSFSYSNECKTYIEEVNNIISYRNRVIENYK